MSGEKKGEGGSGGDAWAVARPQWAAGEGGDGCGGGGGRLH